MNADLMFRMPPIPLSALAEKTKDFILGRASYLRCSPEQVIIEMLDGATQARQPVTVTQPEGAGSVARAA